MALNLRRLAAAAAIATLLGACGGGGGGGGGGNDDPPDPDPPPPPPPGPATYSLTGTISAAQSHSVDSDTNDPSREAVSNNTIPTAQPVTNPITLGGYINQPLAGDPGRSFDSGDREDFFVVEMLAGQTVTMLVADFEEADADLYLYDANGELVDFSVDTGELESVRAETDGTYYINASIFIGATNYILAIGSPGTVQAAGSSQRRVVPWQAVIRYRDAAVTTDLAATQLDLGLGMTQRAGAKGRARLMALRSDVHSRRDRVRKLSRAATKRERFSDPAMSARWETLMAIKSLRGDPQVVFAEPNYRVHALAIPDDEAFPLQWHYPLIGLPDAWDTTTGRADVVVAVVDTGVLPGHPDLVGQFVDGYDFISDPDSAGDGDGIDPDPTDPGDGFGGGAGTFHGTHVAGTVAARGENGIGVTGVAYDARVMPLRALAADGGTTYDVEQAIRYAAGLPNDAGASPENPAQIINLSLGGAPFSQSSQALFSQVRDLGVLVVAAAGNEASTAPSYPAAYDDVISVSAVDTQRILAPYSNTGPTVDVAAPGGNNSVDLTGDGYPDGVLSTGGTVNDGSLAYVYAFLNGTSMSTPHVAGVLALMKTINPDLTPQDIDSLLVTGAITEDLGPPGRDDAYGYGLISARLAIFAALESIGATPADNPRLLASVATLNFGATTTSLGLSLTNGGMGDLELLSLQVSEPWVQLTPTAADPSGLGDYEVTVDRDALGPGIFAADITAESSINTVRVRVFVSVAGAGAEPDVGVIYILLIDPEEGIPVAQVASGGNAGQYAFTLGGVEAGSYELIAGTDADNDLFICDSGEACGAWLTTDQPIRIELDGDLTALDFPVEFQVSIPDVPALQAAGRPRSGRD